MSQAAEHNSDIYLTKRLEFCSLNLNVAGFLNIMCTGNVIVCVCVCVVLDF
jgi:head-tail adaptor